MAPPSKCHRVSLAYTTERRPAMSTYILYLLNGHQRKQLGKLLPQHLKNSTFISSVNQFELAHEESFFIFNLKYYEFLDSTITLCLKFWNVV